MWGAQLGPLLRLLLLLLSPRDGVRAEQPQTSGYLIAAPSVFRSGVEEAISVTIFNSPREVMVQAQLVALGKAVAQSQGAIQDKGTIKLKVPTGLRGQALLKVWGHDWPVEEGPLFHNQTSVTVDSRGASVFIQTDKPVYRPKHRVLISIFTVTPDLRPTSEKLEAYVLDPRGSRMMEWRHLEPLCCGITNMTFPLSDQPVLGEWFVFVEMQGHVYNRSFEVQKYDGVTEAERVIKEDAQGTRAGEWTWIRVTYSASVLKVSLMGSGVSLPFVKKVLKGKAIGERVISCKQQKPGTD